MALIALVKRKHSARMETRGYSNTDGPRRSISSFTT